MLYFYKGKEVHKMFKLNNFKYLLIGVIIGGLLSVPMVQAANTVKLVVNGEDITYKSDVPPQIIDGRTLVPARALAEALGASVEWDEGNNAVIVSSKKDVSIDSPNYQMPQTIQQQQLEKVEYFYIKIQDVTETTMKTLEKEDVEALSPQIKVISALEDELILWGTIDEYKEIKRLYINHVNGMGKALIYLRSGLSGVNPQENYLNAQQYISGYQYTLREMTAELTSLKLKGLLQKQ